MNKEEVQNAIEVLQEAQSTLDNQGHYSDSQTLDKAEAILDVGFNVKEDNE